MVKIRKPITLNKFVFSILVENGLSWYFVSKEENERQNLSGLFENYMTKKRVVISTNQELSFFRGLSLELFENCLNGISHCFYGDAISQEREEKFFNIAATAKKEFEEAV